MTARISIRVLFVFVIALTENGVKGVSKTDEEVVNEVLHLPTPNEIIEEIENDPTFWDERNVRFQLAATFGKLQFESLKMIDENLKVMVAGTVKEIKDMNVTNWESILDYLDKIPYLEMMEERRNFTEDYIIVPKTQMLDFEEDIDTGTAFMIEIWFEKLIKNYYILKEMNINITKLADFVTRGEKITVANALIGIDHKHRALMDIAILRFPDIMHPYFMVFTVQLIAYRKSVRIIFVEHGSSGVLCRFNYARYKPNNEYIKTLRKETKEALYKDIAVLFDME